MKVREEGRMGGWSERKERKNCKEEEEHKIYSIRMDHDLNHSDHNQNHLSNT